MLFSFAVNAPDVHGIVRDSATRAPISCAVVELPDALHGIPTAVDRPPIRVDRSRTPELGESAQRRVEALVGSEPLLTNGTRSLASETRQARERHALGRQQPFDAIRVAPAIAAREQQFAMHLAPIFVGDRRDFDDAPHVGFAGLDPQQHRHQFTGIEPIGFRATAAPIHFNT